MEPAISEETFEFLKRFPHEFTNFLIANKVPLSYYSDSVFSPKFPVRYIRFKLLFPSEEYLQNQLNLSPKKENSDPNKVYEKFEFISNFFSIAESIKIANLDAYKDGKLYGIDLSSASVVLALNPQSDEHILDLCCCPGAKLLFIGDLMGINKAQITGSLTGVDINSKRLKICESLCKKYSLDWIELKEYDGTSYSSNLLYDKVLVDAECTHDGSIKHLKKYLDEYNNLKVNKNKEEIKSQEINENEVLDISNKEKKRRKKQEEINQNSNIYISDKKKKNQWTMEDFKERVLDQKKLLEITNLQGNLLKNAFKLVKAGGIVIYSTCSFIKAQNEEIIYKFCETEKKAELVEVFPEVVKKALKCNKGLIDKTVRFDPINSQSGGMFIAALRKKL